MRELVLIGWFEGILRFAIQAIAIDNSGIAATAEIVARGWTGRCLDVWSGCGGRSIDSGGRFNGYRESHNHSVAIASCNWYHYGCRNGPECAFPVVALNGISHITCDYCCAG